MKKYWFKNKRYGWGWVPATWQGWLVMLLFVLLVANDVRVISAHTHSNSDALMNLVFSVGVDVLALVGVCYLTGEKPRWQWGDRDNEKK